MTGGAIAQSVILDSCKLLLRLHPCMEIMHLVHHAGTMWTGVMEHRHRDTKNTLDLSKLLTSTQNTVPHTV